VAGSAGVVVSQRVQKWLATQGDRSAGHAIPIPCMVDGSPHPRRAGLSAFGLARPTFAVAPLPAGGAWLVVCWCQVGDGVQQVGLTGGEQEGPWHEVVSAVGAVVAA
jgi:hypothetical protein